MARRRTLVSYDIRNDKRRDKVFKALRNFGDHVQFSVFLCELNAMERIRLVATLLERINAREDRVLLVDAGPADASDLGPIEWLGERPEPAVRIRVF
jgi:CRISPR-associated protein Cas2